MKTKEIIESFSALLGILSAFFIFKDLKTQIIAALIVLVVVLFIANILTTKENKKLLSNYQKLKKRRDTLVKQYNQKTAQLAVTQNYWRYLGYLFIATKQESQEERFDNAFNLFNELSAKLENEFTEE
ncbi:MAG: hypothetical protein IK134_05885 [Oscillospiraceae bacterium]|nr:hypothetical protein [Oscillospiraceae bacterium]